MLIRLEHVSKWFGKTQAVRDISLEIPDGELFFLLGPSGCGKTTLLRLLAGFYQPETGNIFFSNNRMNTVPAEQRNCGMVFQNYALWPHLTVEQNVAYGLEVRKIPAPEKKRRVLEALEIVRMAEYAERRPNQLSGGQQQRIALARAIVIHPDVLLLDEPLSNLDARLRLAMRDEIRRIHNQTGITTIYVTHDQTEALSMAHRIALMQQGSMEQIGPPSELYCNPSSPFVADFLGQVNWLDGVITNSNNGTVTVQTDTLQWQVENHQKWINGTPVQIGFRPEAVLITQEQSHRHNSFSAIIEETIYMGSQQEILLKTKNSSQKTIHAVEFNPDTVYSKQTPCLCYVYPQRIMIFAKDNGKKK